MKQPSPAMSVFSDDNVFKSQTLSLLQSTHSLCQSHINTRILSVWVCVVCVNTETGQRQSGPSEPSLQLD